jgi:hypothetical protein
MLYVRHMTKTCLPESADQLLEELFTIFPQYRTSYDGPIHDDTPTFHSVLMAFTPFLAEKIHTFSEAQLRQFGKLVSEAVAQGDSLENAFGTCLLEHLHQIGASKTLRPHLSKLAWEKTRA